MVELNCSDLFSAARYAQKADLLQLLPAMPGQLGNGERFFESFQKLLLDQVDLEQLDQVLYNCAPAIRFMAEEQHWEAEDFTAEDMFGAVRNLQRAGLFRLIAPSMALPGGGDRFFEHCQRILVDKLGVDTMERLLHTLGQCIKFIASDAFTVNMQQKEGSVSST